MLWHGAPGGVFFARESPAETAAAFGIAAAFGRWQKAGTRSPRRKKKAGGGMQLWGRAVQGWEGPSCTEKRRS